MKQGTVKRFTASTFALRSSQPLIMKHLKGVAASPYQSRSQPIPAPVTSDLCSGISCSYFWVLLLTDPAISVQLKGGVEGYYRTGLTATLFGQWAGLD